MKKVMWVVGTVVAIAVAIVVFVVGFNLTEVAEMKEDAVSAGIEDIREETGGTVTEEEMATFKNEGKNPFGQTKSNEQLTDGDYREYIHGMSHQKVKAEHKWGFYEINDERVQWLLGGLESEESQRELNDYDIYKEILERWKAGDFSRADDDHNRIWELQGGTIGRATGILSTEEEQIYIKNQK